MKRYVTRRQMLRGAAALLAAMLGGAGFARATGDGELREVASRLARLFRRPDRARHAGRRYLELHPEEADLSTLVSALLGRSRPRSRRALRALLAARREDDCVREDMVILEGWFYTRSEARLCALAALT